MISKSALKGKITRSKVELKSTYLGEETNYLNIEALLLFFLYEKEEILLFYNNSNGWILTNERIIFPKLDHTIFIKDVDFIDFDDIKNNITTKKENNSLDLHLLNGNTKKINFESGTWYLFFDIFRWIINNYKNGNSTD